MTALCGLVGLLDHRGRKEITLAGEQMEKLMMDTLNEA